ncbi:polyprenyl synthetase family protein [Streptomyces stelliscabiei]|uniref:polyprenyl synthetase family protein n=1 Tax=Streptomyces stelliscabiei TaxID=146820 RepID=UPI002FF119CD
MTTPLSPSTVQMPAQAPHGAVDAAAFGAPHPSAGVEIWYLTGHVRDEDGQEHTWTLSILRHHDADDPAAGPGYCLCVTHHGPAGLAYGTWITPTALRVVRQALDGDQAMDSRVRTALSEALTQGPLLPDRLLQQPVTEAAGNLDITVGDLAALRREEDGTFRLSFRERTEFELVLTPVKPAVPQFGPTGRTPGLTSLFMPHLDVQGALLTADGTRKQVAGRAWFEQDWGATYYRNSQTRGMSDLIWEWAGLHLDNGWEISATHARASDPATGATSSVLTRATAVAPGCDVYYLDMSWQPTRHWTSLSTLNTYPTTVRVSVPALGLEVEVTAPTAGREIRSLTVGRAFWESPATVRGTMNGVPVSGAAVVQTRPDNTIGDIEHYMRRSHDIARAEAAAVYPDGPDDTAAISLLAGTHDGTQLDDTAHARLHQALVAPVLHLLDNPGRSWRPYIAATVLGLLGTDPEPYRPLTAATELMHTSALIVDDIQDGSPTRRGRPSVHEVFGTAETITSGTLGYYTFDPLFQRVPQADPATMLRIYQLYLRAMRAGHAGQALDLAGHHTAFDEAVQTGDPRALLEQIRTTHRLKTGRLVRCSAEVAAILAGADEPQLAAISRYFEDVGIAYQISDDVIDLYGQVSPDEYRQGITVRSPAEDLATGTVTYPVAHATGLLDKADRQRLWAALHARTDAGAIEASDLLMQSGALDVCLTEARELVDHAWQALDPLLPPTVHKAMVRALGWYAAQRISEYDSHAPIRPTSSLSHNAPH